jgi:hypothetical protein
VAGDALEPYAPDRFDSTIIARNVLMFNIFIDVVGELKKLVSIFALYAFEAEIVVGFVFRFEAFCLRSQDAAAFIAL